MRDYINLIESFFSYNDGLHLYSVWVEKNQDMILTTFEKHLYEQNPEEGYPSFYISNLNVKKFLEIEEPIKGYL